MPRIPSDRLKVNGVPMFAPDADIDFSFEDIDDKKSGRDESAVMHRIVIRYKVMTSSYVFSNISDDDYRRMEALFPDAPSFKFTHPDRKDFSKDVVSDCYRSKFGICWHNERTGEMRNYKFNITEC